MEPIRIDTAKNWAMLIPSFNHNYGQFEGFIEFCITRGYYGVRTDDGELIKKENAMELINKIMNAENETRETSNSISKPCNTVFNVKQHKFVGSVF